MKNPTILVDVDENGQVSVYWHDPEMSGRQAPEVSVVSSDERTILAKFGEPIVSSSYKKFVKMINDHDCMKEDQDTEQII